MFKRNTVYKIMNLGGGKELEDAEEKMQVI